MRLRGLAKTGLESNAGGAPAGAACVAYAAAIEVRWFTLRRFTVPVLPQGADPVKVLHLSDLHLMPAQERKISWVNDLARLEPDLVVNTGDNIASPASVPPLIRAYGDLLDLPGVFVFGSNDYWKPQFKNPVYYLLPSQTRRYPHSEPDLPFERMRTAFTSRGWIDLNND